MNQTEQKLGHSLRVELEQLDGGFVSNITGKRRIYKDAHEIDEAIDFRSIISKLDEGEYMINLDVVPKELYQDFLNGVNLTGDNTQEEDISLRDKAIADGVIEKAAEFNPMPGVIEDNSNIITVTPSNAYSAAKLKSLEWKKYDEQLPMTIAEKAIIAGVKKVSMYSLWRNSLKGTCTYQSVHLRVAFTTLARYYEKNLGVRNSSKEQLDTLKEGLLAQLRELELMCSKGNYTKSSAVATSIGRMRKLLI